MTKINWWHTGFTDLEKEAMIAAFDARRISQGAVTAELETVIARFLDVPYAVVSPSGTAALSMALMACDVGPGSEVIVPDLTWIASGHAAHILGAKVVLVDCRSDTPLIDVGEVERAITPATRAIVPVHCNGRPCQMDALIALARPRGIKIVEDSCKAMGSRSPWGMLGTIGDFGCFSMGMISLATIGYGGFVVTRSREACERLRLIRDHGVVRAPEEGYRVPGFNFKVSDLLAAIGVVQFRRAEEKLARIHEIYRRYVAGLKDHPHLRVIPVDTAAGQVPLCVDIQSPRREELIAHLERHDIVVSRFHLPLHRGAHFGVRLSDNAFPNAVRFTSQSFIAPCGPGQSLEDIDRVVAVMRDWPE